MTLLLPELQVHTGSILPAEEEKERQGGRGE